MTEEKLAAALLKRERRVYEALIEEHFRLLWTVAAGILSPVGTREDIEEVVSDVFIALWERPEKFEPRRGSLKNYLCLLARSKALDRLRALRKGRSEELTFEMEQEYSPEEEVLARERSERLLQTVQALPEPEREILLLRFFYGLRPAEIACKFALSTKEIYERLRRGKKLAANLLKEGYDG